MENLRKLKLDMGYVINIDNIFKNFIIINSYFYGERDDVS